MHPDAVNGHSTASPGDANAAISGMDESYICSREYRPVAVDMHEVDMHEVDVSNIVIHHGGR